MTATDDRAPANGVPTGGRSLERLVFFSDAVIAIALTLLALDLPLPAGATNGEMWRSVGHLLAHEYASFALSFVVIGAFWSQHHRFFGDVRDADRRLVRLNLFFLFTIVSLPYVTRLVRNAKGFEVGTVLYAADVALAGIGMIAIIQHVARSGLMRPGVPRARMTALTRGIAVPTAAFLVSIPIAFADTGLAQYAWLVLSVGGGLATRTIFRQKPPAQPVAPDAAMPAARESDSVG